VRPAVAPAIAVLSVALALAGCRGNGPTASSTPSAPAAQPTGLGGGAGEQSSVPRSTILSTPRPTLSNVSAVKELPGPCPYISDQDWADHEGNRVGRSVRLATKPVGCRFYFQYDPSQVTGEITLQRFRTSTEAFNAVVSATKGHPEFVDDKTIGDDGSISIRLALQGQATWACIFSEGATVVTVHTSQSDTSNDARTLGALIAPNIK
jgi:hypothetical protein